MNRIFGLLGRASVRFRYLIVVAWILITILAGFMRWTTRKIR